MLERSIRFYTQQTWPEKELVIVTDGPSQLRHSILRHVDSLGRTDVRCVFVDSPSTVGHLRNVSVEAASGEILCQWDDDDCYHPRRLEVQANHMTESRAEVSFLYDQLHYFEDTGELFWVDWSRQRTNAADQGAPGTLMCRKTVGLRYPAEGRWSSLGEDAVVQVELYRRCKVVGLRGEGFLYTYVYHGQNSFDRQHHRMIVDRMSFGPESIEAKRDLISKLVSEYLPYDVRSLSCKGGSRIDLHALEIPAGDEQEHHP
jgi:hypothetical protein